MLDINFIIESKDKLKETIINKNVKLNVDELISTYEEKVSLLHEIEEINHKRNENASLIQKAGKPTPDMIASGKELKEQVSALEPKLRILDEKYERMMLVVPNIPADDTPVGKDDSENVAVRTWGTKPDFDFNFKDHSELGTDLDLIDTDRGVKVAGFRGYYLKNELALLQWAVLSYALKIMRDKGFTIMIPPTMVRELALVGSGHFPAGREEVYPVEDVFLAGTSEPALLAYHYDETLGLKELPLKYCAVTPCYRSEIGSYGKDTKGLYRVHEFWKVEQVVIAENDFKKSMPLFEEMLGIAESLLQGLKLPYRVLSICTGDMGAGKYKMYDLESWMPSRKAYGETHSCSHLTDWQSRRLKLRYRDDEGVVKYPHTMNNTVVASPRILIAILENYQQEDGSVKIPDVLVPYMYGITEIRR